MSLQEFIDALNAKFASEGYSFAIEQGRKFARVVRAWRGGQHSAYCFVDADGNVLKASSCKAPAKGIRANLAKLDMARVDVYGGWLYAAR